MYIVKDYNLQILIFIFSILIEKSLLFFKEIMSLFVILIILFIKKFVLFNCIKELLNFLFIRQFILIFLLFSFNTTKK